MNMIHSECSPPARRWFSAMTAALALCWAFAASAMTDEEIKALRDDANLMFGPIPDQMPGSEQDTPARIELGRKLYFDTRLSENRSQSCNTCHRIDDRRAGVDNEPTSAGAFGRRGDRNSPTVLNAGFFFAQFWDGRAENLKEQAKGPVLNPIEMAMPDEPIVVGRLEADPDYPKMFAAAFPGVAAPVTYDNTAEAIAAFERTLITHDRFDDWMKGDDAALTDKEIKGVSMFLTIGCTTCHTSPVIGGQSFQKAGLVNPYENTKDLGRYVVTEEDDDKFKFKVPTLRNIALTAPYFHDGKVATLKEVIKKMGHMQLGLELDREQIDHLETFLLTLTDKARLPSQ